MTENAEIKKVPEGIDSLIENGWQIDLEQVWLAKDYQFSSFADAMVFMQRVAVDAESLDHHPNWSNCYKTVSVKLRTHVGHCLTEKDVILASKMDAVYANHAKS